MRGSTHSSASASWQGARRSGAQIADPIIGLMITLVILKITWDSWRTVSTTEPGELAEDAEH
jgi:divalent metal cation (Fe/Co/Zn/Cd) transporter